MSFCVVAGSYEAFLYGYTVSVKEEGEKQESGKEEEEGEIEVHGDEMEEDEEENEVDDEKMEQVKTTNSRKKRIGPAGRITSNPPYHTEPLFAYRPHLQCIKTLSMRYPYLATGGEDETIRVYQLRKRKEVGQMLHHKGYVSGLQFVKNSQHLVASSADGALSVWRKKDWELVTSLTPGPDPPPLRCLSLHPSERVALVGCGDRRVRMWDLMKASCMFTTKQFEEDVEDVLWNPDGSYFVIVLKSCALFYSSNSGMPCGRLDLDKYSLSTFAFVTPKSFVVAIQNSISFYQMKKINRESGAINSFSVQKKVSNEGNGRIRGLSVTRKTSASSDSFLLASANSDGLICLWDMDDFDRPIASIQTNAHLTCVTLGRCDGQ